VIFSGEVKLSDSDGSPLSVSAKFPVLVHAPRRGRLGSKKVIPGGYFQNRRQGFLMFRVRMRQPGKASEQFLPVRSDVRVIGLELVLHFSERFPKFFEIGAALLQL